MATAPRTGIYEIVNDVNGKRYVGSAVNHIVRWRAHRARLNAGNHHSRHLQAAWEKYGSEAFSFRMIEDCPVAELIEREQAAFDRLTPEYNVNPVAGSSLGRRFTDETKAKIAAKARGKKRPPRSTVHRDALSAALKGRSPAAEVMEALQSGRARQVYTDERRARVSASLRQAYEDGRKNRDRSPVYREKIAASLRGRKATPEQRANQSAAQIGKKRGPYNLDPAKADARREAGKKLAAAVNARRWGTVSPD